MNSLFVHAIFSANAQCELEMKTVNIDLHVFVSETLQVLRKSRTYNTLHRYAIRGRSRCNVLRRNTVSCRSQTNEPVISRRLVK